MTDNEAIIDRLIKDAKADSRGYPRTTSLDFLKRCRRETAAFFLYWESKRCGRAMPSRADIDPLEMKSWLPGVALVDVQRNPYRLIYRLVGTRATKLRGQEVTGMAVQDAWFGASLDAALENYRLVIEEVRPVYDWDRTPAPSGFAREAETLLLPLSSDGTTVDMVLVYQEADGV